MFMLLGFHLALTQVAFRIGDSVTNVITPMMSYFALIVAFAQKYDEKYGISTIISTMIPYSILFTIFWILLLAIWMLLGLPLGPDGPLYLRYDYQLVLFDSQKKVNLFINSIHTFF